MVAQMQINSDYLKDDSLSVEAKSLYPYLIYFSDEGISIDVLTSVLKMVSECEFLKALDELKRQGYL